MNIRDRFWSKVDKRGLDECWEWQGATWKFGYGKLRKIKRTEWHVAHRLSWMLHNGPIPDGLCVCHHCDNPSCVNPAHLFVGTKTDNANDRTAKGRQRGAKGEENGTAKLTSSQVLEIRRRHAEGGVEQRQLAREYSIHESQVSVIVNRKQWKHI